MSKFLLALAMLALPCVAFAQERDRVSDFLRAADRGDNEAMRAEIDPKKGTSAKKLLQKIENCYLRAVFTGPDDEILATWMCDEGENRSRVLIASVEQSPNGVRIKIVHEETNNRPAPPRDGPAFDGED